MYFLPIIEVASSTRQSGLQIENELGDVCADYNQVDNTLAPYGRTNRNGCVSNVDPIIHKCLSYSQCPNKHILI